jgi:hypothetical protein
MKNDLPIQSLQPIQFDKRDVVIGSFLISFYALASWVLTNGHGFREEHGWFFHMQDGHRHIINWDDSGSAAAVMLVTLAVSLAYLAQLCCRQNNGFGTSRPSWAAYYDTFKASPNKIQLVCTLVPFASVALLVGLPFLVMKLGVEETPVADFSLLLTLCCSLMTAQAMWGAHYKVWGEAFKEHYAGQERNVPCKINVN